MATDVIMCDNCGKTAKPKEANGWYSLKTLITEQPPFLQVGSLEEVFDPQKIEEARQEWLKTLPLAVGGEFCTLMCTLKFISAHINMIEETGNGEAQA